ncbi:MAG: hypothetical protein AB8F78_09400 [Saprospiraceae bacterium]
MIHILIQSKVLRALTLAITYCFIAGSAQAQLGVAFYQSTIPFIGVSYEINDRIRPELSIGADQNFRFISTMLDVNYDFVEKENHEVYAGLGYLLFDQDDGGLTIPIGVNVYPFGNRQFGFHIEAMPTFLPNRNLLLGSWGIRYKFGKDE